MNASQKLLTILITTGLAGCVTEPVQGPVHYGISQITVDGNTRFVLCNPCSGPTHKETDHATAKTALVYGESIYKGARLPAPSPGMRMVSTATVVIPRGVVVEPAKQTGSVEPDVEVVMPATEIGNTVSNPSKADTQHQQVVDKSVTPANKPDHETANHSVLPDVDKTVVASIATNNDVIAIPEKLVVTFENNSYELDQEALSTLAKVIRAAGGLPSIRIVGYTDNTGAKDYNDWIAQARMEAVRDWLQKNGLNKGNLEANTDDSRGHCCYVAENTSGAGRSLNRRVEIEFIRPTTAEVGPKETTDINASTGQEASFNAPAERNMANKLRHEKTEQSPKDHVENSDAGDTPGNIPKIPETPTADAVAVIKEQFQKDSTEPTQTHKN